MGSIYVKKEKAKDMRPDYESTVLEDAFKNDRVPPFSPERMISGIASFAEKAGISKIYALSIYNKGIIDDAVVKFSSKKVMIDFPLAMRLIKEYGERQGGL